MLCFNSHKFQEKWDWFALHTWLILSSYGIMFALISFIDDMGGLNNIKTDHPWIKGIMAILLGMIFYISIGLRHLEGAKRW
jgi:hypothetical protein